MAGLLVSLNVKSPGIYNDLKGCTALITLCPRRDKLESIVCIGQEHFSDDDEGESPTRTKRTHCGFAVFLPGFLHRSC